MKTHRTGQKHYIFRWKDDGICVIPSRSETEEEVWDFASRNLIPAFNRPPHPMQWVKDRGEVVEDDE